MKLPMQIVQQALAQLSNMDISNIKLTFTDISLDEANIILQGLQELPAKICNPLTAKLQEQAAKQLPKPEESK